MSNAPTDPDHSAMPMVGRQRFRQRLQWSCPVWTASRRPINSSTTRHWKRATTRWPSHRLTWCAWASWCCTIPHLNQWYGCRRGLHWTPTGDCSPWACSCTRTHPNCCHLRYANKTYKTNQTSFTCPYSGEMNKGGADKYMAEHNCDFLHPSCSTRKPYKHLSLNQVRIIQCLYR